MAGLRLELDPDGVLAGARQAKSAIESVAQEAVETEKRLKGMGDKGKDLARIKAGLDPVYAASLKAKNAVREYDAALDAGIISANQYASAMQRIAADMDRAAAPASGLASIVGNYGHVAQQVGFQVQDLAVQIGAGTSAVQAFAQQGSQLLGIMGPWGAIFGAALAVVLPLSAALLGGAEAGREFSDVIADMEDAVSSFRSALQTSWKSVADLRDEFGTASPVLRAALVDLANIEKVKAFESINATAASIRALVLEAGWFSDASANTLAQGFLGFTRNSDEARRAADDFLAKLQELNSADPGRQLAAALDLRAQLEDAAGGYKNMNDEQRTFYEGLTNTIVQLQAMGVEAYGAADGMTAFGSAAGDAQGLVGGLVGQVGALADRAWSAARGMIAFAQKQAEAAAGAVMSPAAVPKVPSGLGAISLPQGFNPYDKSSSAPVSSPIPKAAPRDIDFGVPKASGRGGGGGGSGKSAVQEAADDYNRLRGSLDPVVRAEQEYAKAQETVNAALKAGYISQEQANETLALAKKRLDEAQGSATGFSETLTEIGGSALDRLISGTGDLRDIWKDVLKQIVLAAAQQKLMGSVKGASKGDSVGTLIFKGLFGGFFDDGGTLPMGQFGIVGENGPELVKSTSSGAVITSRVDTASMMRGGGVVEVQGGDLTLTDNGQIMARVQIIGRQAAQAGASAAVGQVRSNWGGWSNEYAQRGALA